MMWLNNLMFSWTLYNVIQITFIGLMVLCSIIAIIIVVVQPGNSSGIDALGGSSETFFSKNKGRSKESKLKIATGVSLTLLALLSIAFFLVELFYDFQ